VRGGGGGTGGAGTEEGVINEPGRGGLAWGGGKNWERVGKKEMG